MLTHSALASMSGVALRMRFWQCRRRQFSTIFL